MTGVKDGVTDTGMVSDFLVHSFPGRKGLTTGDASPVPPGQSEEHNESQNPHSWQHQPAAEHSEDGMGVPIAEMSWEEERERRIYRGRTIRMLRRFMRYSIETGRLPSVFGREFFRTPITPYSFVTFEDRVIFVHDMETSLNKLDEFSRELIARHFLQEHDQEATARLLHCAERTIRTYVPIALDLLSEILLDSGMLDRTFPIREKSCQGGKSDENFVSSCEESKNKF
jgi:hypothetical protein